VKPFSLLKYRQPATCSRYRI